MSLKLKEILHGLDYTTDISPETEISGINCDSRNEQAGNIYVAIVGEKFDGHEHGKEAARKGAVAVVCERDLGLKNQILVENSRATYALLCANYHGNPGDKLKLIAVTGTNGKTTVSTVIWDCLKNLGVRVGLISTIDIKIGDFSIPAKYTTPDAAQLQALLSQMVSFGCEYVVLETSSHAFVQHRLEGLNFEIGVFTNLSQDHLDFHHSMEEYFRAKAKIFEMSKKAVINADDSYGKRLIADVLAKNMPLVDFSVKEKGAKISARAIEEFADRVQFILEKDGKNFDIRFGMPGEFSVSNALAATSVLSELGFSGQDIAAALSSCLGVKGRSEVIKTGKDFTVIRDFAHASEGVRNILSAVTKFAKGRIITVFGCAGERDENKRAQMGEIVADFSDVYAITSDNPRREDEMKIINQAYEGARKHERPHLIEKDRYKAIEWALSQARKDDIVLLLGKGHEDYQVLAQATIAFDEREIVKGILNV